MTQQEVIEHRKAYEKMRSQSEEYKAKRRERSRLWYYRNKEKQALEEQRREAELKQFQLPEVSGILATDCCKICKHFSKVKGVNSGWCMRKKKSVSSREICGEFNPITDEKFTKVIYKTPGVKNIRGNG